jgi:hypothetical protein
MLRKKVGFKFESLCLARFESERPIRRPTYARHATRAVVLDCVPRRI